MSGDRGNTALRCRRVRPHRCASLILALCLLAVLSGCTIGATPTVAPIAPRGTSTVSDRAPGPTPRGEQALTLALGGDLPTLDPALVRDANSSFLAHQLFRGLVRLDTQLNAVPDLAERIAVSDDGLTYTFTLRPDLIFHNGTPLDAEAVRYSLERATDPTLAGGDGASLPGATYLGDILGAADKLLGRSASLAGLRVLDARTVEIRLGAPKIPFLMKLSYPVAAIVDAKTVRAGGVDWARAPNGSGPFRLVRLTDGQIELRRFERFYTGAPVLERVTFLYGEGAGSPMNLYEAGKIDATRVPLSSVDRVLATNSPLHAELTVTPTLSLTYIGFNVTKPPYDDPATRRAFAQAVDRERLTTVGLDGKATLADGIVPATMPGGPWAGRVLSRDLDAARAALAARPGGAGSVGGARIYGAGGQLAVSLRKVYARDLGITLEAIDVPWPTYLVGLSARDYPAFELTWVADYPDPENFLALLFGTGSGENHTGYSNPAVDALLNAAAGERDPARRRDLYLQAQQLILDDAVVIPCYYSTDYTLVKPYVRGLAITPLGVQELDTVWIER